MVGWIILGIVVLIVLFNWIPIMMFIGFSGGFRHSSKPSSTTYRYDKEVDLLRLSTHYFGEKDDVNEYYRFTNVGWVYHPDGKKCKKKLSLKLDNYRNICVDNNMSFNFNEK